MESREDLEICANFSQTTTESNETNSSVVVIDRRQSKSNALPHEERRPIVFESVHRLHIHIGFMPYQKSLYI